MCCGREPGHAGFLERSPRQLFAADEAALRAALPPDCPPSLGELSLQLLRDEPDERPAADAAAEWLMSLSEELARQGDDPGGDVPLPPCKSPVVVRDQGLRHEGRVRRWSTVTGQKKPID